MSPDFKDLLSEFNAQGVEYLVVGAFALAAHGRIRATGDLDVWIKPTKVNAKRVLRALAAFGAPTAKLREGDLATPGTVFQIGEAPLRIDVLTGIDAVGFDEAWRGRFAARFAGIEVPVLSAAHLIQNKRAVGRAQDKADVEWLEKKSSKVKR
ncbi:MAG: hypothetical protein ACT4P9_14080 [Betaproteobacteria bacterium]